MMKKTIRLATINDVRDFVDITRKYDMDIDLASGRYIVDGKSIMGIFSLDLLQPITLTAYGDEKECDEFFKETERFDTKE